MTSRAYHSVSLALFFFILLIFGIWCTLNFIGGNRVTGGFVSDFGQMKSFLLPWLGVLAFIVFVAVVNFRKK